MTEEEPGLAELKTRFVRGFLDVTIMKMLLEEPIWGYKMMEVLRDMYGVKVSPPVIYPLLDSMEKTGSSWQRKSTRARGSARCTKSYLRARLC